MNATAAASGAAHITANGGTLELQKAITNTGALALTVTGANDKLLLDAASAATSASFNGSTGTLELNSAATLTLNNALAIGAGTLKLDGAATTQLTDSAGVTLAGGAISGTGYIAAATTLSGYGTVSTPMVTGAGTITASGDTLDLQGAVRRRPLAIATGSASDLKIDGTATSSAAITINDTNQTLEVGAAGNLTITGAEKVTNGTIKLDGGTLTDSSGVTIGSGATFTGFGTVVSTLAGSGTVTASGGTLKMTSGVSGAPRSRSAAAPAINCCLTPPVRRPRRRSPDRLGRWRSTRPGRYAQQCAGDRAEHAEAGRRVLDPDGRRRRYALERLDHWFGRGECGGGGTAAADITATGGTLEVTGAITNSGTLALAIGGGASDKLLLDAASAASSATFSGSSGTLEIGASGSLTLTNALKVGANTLELDGGLRR